MKRKTVSSRKRTPPLVKRKVRFGLLYPKQKGESVHRFDIVSPETDRRTEKPVRRDSHVAVRGIDWDTGVLDLRV